MNLGAGQPASLPYGVEPQWWYSYHSMQFSSPLQQSDLPFSSVCYHPPPPGNYPPPLHLTQPNHYPPPHHFTPPNPYPPLLHFADPNSYPPPPTPNPYSAYAYHPHQPSYPHTQPHFIPTNQVVPSHITHEPPAPIADLMHVEPDPPLPRLDEFMESMSRLLEDCVSKCFKGMRVSEDSSPSLRDHVPVPTQMPKSQSSEPRNCSPLRQQPNTKPSPRLGDAQSLMFSTSRIEQAFGGAISATGRVKKRRYWKRNKLLMRNKSLFQSSDVPSLLGNSVSAQSSINTASDCPVSVLNLNFVNHGCGSTVMVPGATLSGVNVICDYEKRSSGKNVEMDGGNGKGLGELEGISGKQGEMQGSYSAECRALKVFDKTSNSDGFRGSGVAALTSIRDKGGGIKTHRDCNVSLMFTEGCGSNCSGNIRHIKRCYYRGRMIAANPAIMDTTEYDGLFPIQSSSSIETTGKLEEAWEVDIPYCSTHIDTFSKELTAEFENAEVLITYQNISAIKDSTTVPISSVMGCSSEGNGNFSTKTDEQGLNWCEKNAAYLSDEVLQSNWLFNVEKKMAVYMGIRDKGGGLTTHFETFDATHISIKTSFQLPDKEISGLVASKLYCKPSLVIKDLGSVVKMVHQIPGFPHHWGWCKQELGGNVISAMPLYVLNAGDYLAGNKILILVVPIKTGSAHNDVLNMSCTRPPDDIVEQMNGYEDNSFNIRLVGVLTDATANLRVADVPNKLIARICELFGNMRLFWHVSVDGTVSVLVSEDATSNQASSRLSVQEHVLVRKIIKLQDKYGCLIKHSQFHKALKESYVVLYNKAFSGNSNAELLTGVCDDIFKKGGSGKLSKGMRKAGDHVNQVMCAISEFDTKVTQSTGLNDNNLCSSIANKLEKVRSLLDVMTHAVASVDQQLQQRDELLMILKRNLELAQFRRNQFYDQKHTEMEFAVLDWVYVKLQHYKQHSVQNQGWHKLSPQYYGPFQVTERSGKVPYRLKLPATSKIHNVFHVSLLKKKLGDSVQVSPSVPPVLDPTDLKWQPAATLARRIDKKGSAVGAQWLIKGEGVNDDEATWEDAADIQLRIPGFHKVAGSRGQTVTSSYDQT